MGSALLPSLLAALRYPHAAGFAPTDDAALRPLVAWLEHTKARIRLYPEDGRAALDATGSPDWPQAFSQYLSELECPIPLDGGSARAAVVQWLLAHAVALEYEDSASELNAQGEAETCGAEADAAAGPSQAAGGGRGTKRAAAAAAGRPRRQQKEESPFPDLDSPEARRGIAEVLRLLRVEGSSGGGGGGGGGSGGSDGPEALADQLQAAWAVLRDSVLPALTDEAARTALAPGGLQKLPLGFETGDPSVDAAATLLRLLYIKDLRLLQTAVDEAIVSVQELTANPKTDSALGKVGR